jgi:hypothetical protein
MTEKFMKIEESDNQIILLVDYTISLEIIKKIHVPFSKIITLDFESHKILKSNNINHEISDDYITKNILDEIQNKCYEFSHWYNNFENLIQYHEINLGKLFYIEFHYFLIPILKKFVELIEICKKYSNTKLLVSKSTYKIIHNLSNSLEIIYDNDDGDLFLYEKVHFNLTNSIGFDISRKQYRSIKGLSEKILEKIIRSNGNINKKSILFVEFDPIKYESVFVFPKKELDFILYNRRRPSIWNKQSYDIVKQSKCIIPPFNKILKSINQEIFNGKKIIIKQIESLLTQENFFQTFFSIFDHSFWYVIQDEFTKLCKKRFSESIEEILIAEHVFENFKPSVMVLWSESGFNEQIMLGIAKKFKISTILIQHGIYIDDSLADLYYDFTGIFPYKSDKFLTWGNVTKKYAMKHGIPENKIQILGHPAYDKLIPDTTFNEDYILLATTSPRRIFIPGYGVSENEMYENIILEILRISKKLKKKLIIKLHPFQDERNIQDIIQKFDGDIQIIKHGSIIPLLKKCEFLISIGISSALIESQLLQKPAISIPVSWDNGIPHVVREGICYKSTLENLEKTIMSIKPILNKQMKFEENLANHGKSTELFLAFLRDF